MRDDKSEDGFALLLVLIALATLSLIVAASVNAARSNAWQARGGVDALRLDAALDAAVLTVARDFAQSGTAPPAELLRPRALAIDGISVTVEVKSEGGRIDLNAAPPELIAALLEASGVGADKAVRLADEIADWRDGDSSRRLHGAEASEYLSSGRPYVPPNRAFETVSELALILDGGEDLTNCLAADVTVFGHGADIDPNAASPRVRRAALMSTSRQTSQPGTSIIGGRFVEAGAMFEVEASAVSRERRRVRETLLRFTGNPADPVWVVSQASPPPRKSEVQSACRRLAQ